MSTSVPIDLQFKGDRAYVHGTDVYESAVALLREASAEIDGRCRFTFHRMTGKPLAAIVAEFAPGAARPSDCIAEMHVTGGAKDRSVWFVEREGKIAGRYAYDEDAVVRDCTLEANSIVLSVEASAKPIETIVAMTKRLHNSIAKPVDGRWLFTRLDLRRLLQPCDRAALCVSLASPARGAITRSDITSHGEPIGSIYFSIGRP